MSVEFCCEALREALEEHGAPGIFNTDQGAQFTSPDFTGMVEAAGTTVSMDGKGRATDNVFVERVWRSLKYEDIYLRDYEDLDEAREGISRWVLFYNLRRPHQGLRNHTPMAVYRDAGILGKAA